MIKHVELTADFYLTCWVENKKDFEIDTRKLILEDAKKYFYDNPSELIENLEIVSIR